MALALTGSLAIVIICGQSPNLMHCDFPDGDRTEEEKESHQCAIGIADKSFEQTIEEG